MAITTLGYGAFPAGNIIQVQSTTTNTAVSNTSTGSNLDLMSVNITPTFSNSKILVMLSAMFGAFNPNGALQLLRDSTNLATAASTFGGGTGFMAFDDFGAADTEYRLGEVSFHHLDTPSTTSQVSINLKVIVMMQCILI
tara:strand:- start:129 stop:548 length:420 start_codon:yes stop_codon:yes gene_type:complete